MTTEETVTVDDQLPKELPQAQKDAVLKAVKDAVGGVADEVVENNYKNLQNRIDERFDQLQRAKTAEAALKEMAGGKSIIGAISAAVLRGRNRPDRVGEEIEKCLGADVCKALGVEVKDGHVQIGKSLNTEDFTAGGALIAEEHYDQWFDVLRPSIAVLSLGPVELPMPSLNLTVSGFTGDMTASYVGEPNTQEVQSEPTTGQRKLNAKTLMTLVPISNQMLSVPAGPRISNFIDRQAQARQSVRQDQALIRGSGADFEPRGLTNWATNTTNSGGTTLTLVLADFGDAINRMETANVPMTKPGIIFAPRTKNFLMFQLLDGDSRPFFLEEMRGGTVLGIPFRTTTNVPTNLGGGSNESEIILGDFDHILYGTPGQLAVEYFSEASYTLNGSLVSATERNEQVLRLIDYHDLQVEHEDAVEVIDAVTYGA